MSPIHARFEFAEDRAAEFGWDGQSIVELEVDTVEEIVEYCEQFGDAIIDCTASVNGKVISASEFA